MFSAQKAPEPGTVLLRFPESTDGMALHRLIANSPPLDPNSAYCNLLHCSHFAQTSVAAECDGRLVGFISAYVLPDRPDTLFVWQVVVDGAMRGRGLGKQMLREIVQRPACRDVRFMETTVTPDNQASWGMFRSFAQSIGADITDKGPYFERDAHFDGQHDSEHLALIGPFS